MAVTRIKTSGVYGSKYIDALAGLPAVPPAPTATAAVNAASVAFSSVAGATSYTVISTPGSFTATGASSPLSVTGLTGGTSYTFQLSVTTSAGTSGYSQPSNSVTALLPVGRMTRISPPVSGDEVSTVSIAAFGSNLALTGVTYVNSTNTVSAYLGVLDTNLANVAQNTYAMSGRTSPDFYGADTHPSGNLHVAGGTPLGYSIAINPSTYATSLGRSNNNAVYNVTFDQKVNSSDNFNFSCGWYNGTGDGMLIKRDSSLTAVWGRYYNASVFSYLHALAVEQTTSGAIYTVGDIQRNPREGIIMKVASGGGQTWVRSLTGGSGTTCILEDVKLASGTDPVVVGYYQSSGIIAKWNAAGTFQWQNGISGATLYGIAQDSNGSTVLGNSGYIFRFNNSGVLQWQRRLTASSGSINWQKIYTDGSNYYAAGKYSSTSSETVVLKMPLDGSGSGSSVVLGDRTFTYSTSSLVVASEGLTEASTTYTGTTFTVQDNSVTGTRSVYSPTVTNSAI